MTMTMFKIKKKKQNSFQILVHIQIWNFFFFFFYQFFFCFFFLNFNFPPCPNCISGRVHTDWGNALVPPSVRLAPCLDLLCLVLSSCSHFLRPVCLSVCLWVGRGQSLEREQYAGQAGTVILAMYTFMVGPWLSNTQQHYFRRSNTHTWNAHTQRRGGGGWQEVSGRQKGSRWRMRRTELTDPSDALAPTLSPAAFQQTSKIPPVPL